MSDLDVTEIFGPDADDDARPATGNNGRKDSQATAIVRLARETGAEFFQDDETAFIYVRAGSHYETYALRSKRGRAWLLNLYIDSEGKSPGSQAVTDAVNSVEALALRGDEHRVYVRMARQGDTIYMDLADPTWSVVEITAAGWRLIANAPVRFRRPRGLLPIPAPTLGAQGHDITLLRRFVNVGHDDFVLLVAVLVAMLRGRGPFPTLNLLGEQGSAKSTLSRIVKQLIDPNTAPLRSEPREPRDLMIAATNNHILVFDNMSHLSQVLSDCLCRLSTGGGFSTRMLYENSEEQIFDAVRPVVLNGITEMATRPDLVSRMVTLTLPTIPDGVRRDETAFWTDFAAVQPRLLGALLTIVSVALKHETTVTLEKKPRMADFALWIAAAEPACPWPAGRFLELYAGNRQEAVEASLDGDAVADAAKSLAPWTGTAKELLDELNRRTPEATQRRPDWFRRPRQVSDALRRLAPALRQVAVNVTFTRTMTGRRITIGRLEQEGETSSCASYASSGPNGSGPHDVHDAGHDAHDASASPGSNGNGRHDAHDAHDARRPHRSNDTAAPPFGISPAAWAAQHTGRPA